MLAVEHPGSLVILDDRQGRGIAIHLGLNVIGTLGILLIAKRKGLTSHLPSQSIIYKHDWVFASRQISRPRCCGKWVSKKPRVGPSEMCYYKT
jgi:predicted nucleic acid-binding protein